MFDTLLPITYLVLRSYTSCLFTYFNLSLSVSIKHLYLFFSFITDINGFFEIPTPDGLFYFDPRSPPVY